MDDPVTAAKSRFGLERQGMRHLGTVHWNQSMPVLYQHAVHRGEGEVVAGGALSLRPRAVSGRTPPDKKIFEGAGDTEPRWGGQNKHTVDPRHAARLHHPEPAHPP